MWNPAKSAYLQSRINPVILNICSDAGRSPPKKWKLSPLEPKSIASEFEPGKTNWSYGLSNLPRLLKEASCKNINIQYKALNNLIDVLVNPLELYRAITEYDIVKKLEAILLWHTDPCVSENVLMINKILIILARLAENFEASWRLIVQYELLDAIYCIIINSKCLKNEAANIFKLMSSHRPVADVMLIQGHLNRLKELLQKIDNIENIYYFLANLLERAPAVGMELLIYDFLIPKLCIRDNLLPIILKCIAFLLNTADGHDIFDQIDGVRVLYNLLKDETVDGMLLENTIMALKNCTIRKISLWRCREFWDLPIILVKHAHNKENDILQLYCLQTLYQITVMPSVKDFVRNVCKKHIKTIECRKEFVTIAKKKLLEWLRKKKYINIESKDGFDGKQEKSVQNIENSSDSETETSENTTLDEKMKIKGPKPIAYRLDYGNVLQQKGSSENINANFVKMFRSEKKLATTVVNPRTNRQRKKPEIKESTQSKRPDSKLARTFTPLLQSQNHRAIFVKAPPQSVTYIGEPSMPCISGRKMSIRRPAVIAVDVSKTMAQDTD